MSRKSSSDGGEFGNEPTSEVPWRRRARTTTRELSPPSGEAQLVILAGRDRGKRYVVSQRAVIGRHGQADISLQDEGVSSRHAAIARTGDGVFVIEDLGSRNGTRVNGASVEQQQPLAFGDKISVGARTVLVFTYADPLEEQLVQLQKMEAIGQLAAGVAHEFNNLLAVVMTNLDLLSRGNQLSPGEAWVCVEEARQATRRGAELTRRMLDYSRLSDASRQAIDLSGLLSEVRDLATRTFDRAIDFQVDIAGDLRVHGDRLQLYQAVMNLLINAKDAMPRGGTLTLAAAAVELDESQLESVPNLAPGPHVQVSVSDTGTGMSEETLCRACEPFFTTKRAGEGTGLGLSMARSIAHGHGGDLSIESHEGRGTTVRFYVPRVTARPAVVPAAHTAPLDDSFTGAVLVVDDDLLVARSLSRTLRLLGLEVITAESGEEALEQYRNHCDEIRVVLLDVVMPGMGGERTLAELRAIDPDVRVVISSGYTQGDVIRRMLDDGALGFLKKPYEVEQLKRAIRGALDGTSTSINDRRGCDPE